MENMDNFAIKVMSAETEEAICTRHLTLSLGHKDKSMICMIYVVQYSKRQLLG